MERSQHIPATPRRLVVVDPRFEDYQLLGESALTQAIRLTACSSGADALRLSASFSDALWLINPQLPDIDGLDLLEMLDSLQRELAAVVIDNSYDPNRESRTLQSRAAIQYVCKPLQLSWLKDWRVHRPREPSRIVPPPGPHGSFAPPRPRHIS